MKYLLLRKGGHVAVSDEDFAFLNQWRWTKAKNGYPLRYENGRTVWLHREIFKRMLGADIPFAMQVDHRDTDKLNATRDNLRLATRSQNQANKRPQKNKIVSHKGVSYLKGRYETRISWLHHTFYLGRFDTADEAGRVYDAAANLLFKEFARWNFEEPQPDEMVVFVQTVLERAGVPHQ